MDINSTSSQNEQQQILETIQQIQDSAELRAEAQTNPDAVLGRFQLSAIARQAVALGIAGLLVAPVVVHVETFWA
jgi:hypothetical protein